jgi:3-phytase
MKPTPEVPEDPALPGLAAIHAKGLARAIPTLALDEGRPVGILLCGYEPGLRATLEARTGERRFAIKAYAHDPAPEAALYKAFASAGLGSDTGARVPRLLAFDHDLRVLVLGWVEGPTAHELVKSGQGARAGELAARWLRCARSLAVKLGSPYGAARMLERAREWVADLAAADPALGTAATTLARTLSRTQPRESDPGLVHGTFYSRHVLDHADGPTVIDWERFGQGPAELDAGMYLATISRLALFHKPLAREAARAEEAFLTGAAGLMDERALAWHRAAALLRLSHKRLPARRRERDWWTRARTLLGEAARVAESPVRALLLAGAIGWGLAASSSEGLAAPTIVRPEARAQTEPVPHDDDSADDPAVWIHPRDPRLSLILGTDKDGALHAYNMDGSEHQTVGDGTQPNNVDVIYGFELGGRTVDLAVASVRSKEGKGVKVWAIDAATRRLSDVTEGKRIQVFGGSEPYGACGYRSARTGISYFFVTNDRGGVEQYRLRATGSGGVTGTKVRSFEVGSIGEGCVADDELGFFYLSEEKVGVWKFGAEPESGSEGKLVAQVGENGLAADVEGLAIYHAGPGRGYLIVSSQGNHTFKVYERAGENRYVLTIDPSEGRIDDVSETDGIAVTNCPSSPEFTKGVLVVHDGKNESGNQNFKLYAWQDIAGSSLVIDTTCRPRRAARASEGGGRGG